MPEIAQVADMHALHSGDGGLFPSRQWVWCPENKKGKQGNFITKITLL